MGNAPFGYARAQVACALGPTMVLNNETHGNMTTKKVAEILNRGDEGEQNGS